MFGEDSIEVSGCHVIIGTSLNYQAKYPEALTSFRKALKIQERVFGSDHMDVAGTYHNFGVVYNNQGKQEMAQQMFRYSYIEFEISPQASLF